MKFDIKRDWWIQSLLFGSVLMIVPLIFTVPQDERWILILTTVLMALLIIPFATMGYYELREDHLYMRIGFIFGRIKYENIKSIQEKDGFMGNSSMAMSNQRVEIVTYGKSKMLHTTFISPENREYFMMELRRHCKNLEGFNTDFDTTYDKDSY